MLDMYVVGKPLSTYPIGYSLKISPWRFTVSMQNILLVDDDPSIRNMLVEYLSQHAFDIKAFENGVELMRHMMRNDPDLVIVDLNLGREDGLELVRKLHAKREVPTIIISGDRMNEIDKVVGLELGAMDYITKPFGMREFLARVRVALRERPERKTNAVGKIFSFDEWRVNTKHRKVRGGDANELKLTSAEFNLLLAFLKSPQQILSREQLLVASRIYDQEIYDRSIDVLILRLRRKLESDASSPKYIKTERGAGYYFDAPVMVEDIKERSRH